LRKTAHQQYTLKKTMSAVAAMSRLHNYLIEVGEEKCPSSFLEEDERSLAVNGEVPFSIRDGVRVPLQIMDSSHHHDDDDPTRHQHDISSIWSEET